MHNYLCNLPHCNSIRTKPIQVEYSTDLPPSFVPHPGVKYEIHHLHTPFWPVTTMLDITVSPDTGEYLATKIYINNDINIKLYQ